MAATPVLPPTAIGTYVPRSKVEAARLSKDDIEEISDWLTKSGYTVNQMQASDDRVELQVSGGGPALTGTMVHGGHWIALIEGDLAVFTDAEFTSMYELG